MMFLIGGIGIAVGWLLRGVMDQVLLTIMVRVLSSAIGKEQLAKAMARVVAKVDS